MSIASPDRPTLTRTVLTAGIIVGTLDITGACLSAYVRTNTPPSSVFKYISGALLGMSQSFSGGNEVIALGLVMHYLIAFSWTVLFFLLYPRVKFLSFNPILTAVVWGAVIWTVMTLLVLPLTKVPPVQLSAKGVVIGMGILIVAIGLPLALFARTVYK